MVPTPEEAWTLLCARANFTRSTAGLIGATSRDCGFVRVPVDRDGSKCYHSDKHLHILNDQTSYLTGGMEYAETV